MIAPGTLDVIVVAGDRRGSRHVLGDSKIFLPIDGAPVVHHVLAAVEHARCTGRIFVVGDRERLERSLRAPGTLVRGLRPLTVVEQGDTLYENAWRGFQAVLGPDAPPSPETEDLSPAARDTAVLVVSGDAPLLVPEEIDELVDASDLDRCDFVLGVASEATLAAYYPSPGRRGIAMTYWDLRELAWRQTSLHLVRPGRLGNRGDMQKIYELRHQRDVRSMLRLFGWLRQSGLLSRRAIAAFLRLQLARLARRLDVLQAPLVRPLLLDRRRMEAIASSLGATRFAIVETHFGGAALDVDDAESYAAITENFTAWRAHQRAIASSRDSVRSP